ncbi:E3 ubiquitin-protein ligase Topors-like isoform X2 [Rhineura floridana]|uniref:E3 ubiquitin-protein ligase Topors-like isoform X2 n=1 Tax=Rhineura floridana TaxID=261503 RepID=UPI002AC86117|nr:E3 ubiquitin-protein ligase Topors-like isoform X2 [Rhineura floridana]
MSCVSGSAGAGQQSQKQPSLLLSPRRCHCTAGLMGDPRELRSRTVGANGHRRQRSKPSVTSVMDDFTPDHFSPRPGTNKLHQTMPVDASPDSKCPICLDKFENMAHLDHCWHKFCFRCVQEWSKNKAECPLCKQPFHSIVHSRRSEDDFKVYTVRPSNTDYFANPDGRRFRYRTTLTRERRASVYPRRSSSFRRTVSPPDNGILFEGLSGQTMRQRNAEMHQMLRRLASRRQASLEGRSMRQIQEQEIINFRRALYRSGTRVRSIEDGGRYRDISAEFFRRNPACLHRLVPWLKRELTVLFGAHGSLINIVQHIIMSNVTRYDLESQAFADDLKPFLLHRTVHFLHEFISFARCPFNIEAYDQHANYDCPAPSYEEGSRSDSSIITISPDEAQEPEHHAFTDDIGQAPWDDETPGPSYSSSEQVHAAISTTLDTSESSDGEPSANPAELQAQLPAQVEMNGDSCDSSDNCVIVGYVKPLAERTPELVELSSDSEESADGEKSEDVKKVQPIQYHSFSDTDASGYASPFSIGSRDGSTSYKTNVSLSSKRKSKRSEDNSKTRESATQSWLQSSPTKRDGDDDYSLSKRRKSESYAQRSCSREGHGLKSKRKHRSMEKGKRKRDSSRHKRRKDKKKSRTRDKSLSRKSQTLSLSSESIESRDLSRSRSHSHEYSKSRSKSKDRDYYIRDSYVRDGKYKWECTIYSRNTARDGYESLYRRRTQARAQYSRQSATPDYRMQSFSERTNTRNQRGLRESRYYYYERRRSRSRSSSRSRTPPRGHDRVRYEKPSGKRKYKTHHLESAHGGIEEASSTKEGSVLELPLPKHKGFYKKAGSLSDRQPEAESQHKKRKKMSRSPSVEIIYEGKATDMTRHHKKKRKRERKPHKSHMGSFPYSSPVVITIDSDSDKDTEIQENTECDSSISWSPTIQQNEREVESPSSLLETRDCNYDRVDELESMDKDSSVTTTMKVVDETPNAALQPQGTASGHTPSLTDIGTSFGTGNQLSNVETESVNQLPAIRMPLLLRISRKLIEHSCKLDSPEQKV